LDANLFLRKRLTAYGIVQAHSHQAHQLQWARIEQPARVTLHRPHPGWTRSALLSARVPRPAISLSARRCLIAPPKTLQHSPRTSCRRTTEEARVAGCYAARMPQQITTLESAVLSASQSRASTGLEFAGSVAGAASVVGVAGLGGLGDAWSATQALVAHRRIRRDAQQALQRHSATGLAFVAQVQKQKVSTHNPALREEVVHLAPEWLAARKAQQTLHATDSAGKELAVDALRYNGVTWIARAASLTRKYAGIGWAGLASSILGVVGGALQAVSGAMKLHTARRTLQRIQRAQNQCRVAQAPAASSMKTLCRALKQHRCKTLERQHAAALSKRTKALAELATGTLILTLGALAFAFPPMAIGMLTAGLVYAAYRVIKGVQGRALAQRSAAQATQWRTAADSSDAHLAQRTQTLLSAGGYSPGSARRQARAEMLAENSHYALRDFAKSWKNCAPDDRSGVVLFLTSLGVASLDALALELLLDAEDAADISQRLAQLLECPA